MQGLGKGAKEDDFVRKFKLRKLAKEAHLTWYSLANKRCAFYLLRKSVNVIDGHSLRHHVMSHVSGGQGLEGGHDDEHK